MVGREHRGNRGEQRVWRGIHNTLIISRNGQNSNIKFEIGISRDEGRGNNINENSAAKSYIKDTK